MQRHEMADLIDRLDAGTMQERIAAANIRKAALRGYQFVMNTTERQRDCWFPCSFRNRHDQELAATASVLVACELQLIVEIFPLKPGMDGQNAYA
jgi:hypothetical protein